MGLGTIFILGKKTFVLIDIVFISALICGSFAYVLHLIFFKKLFDYKLELLFLSFLGYAPIVVAILLALNFFIHGKSETIYYKFIDNASISLSTSTFPIKVPILDERFKNYQHMLIFYPEDVKSKTDRVSESHFTIAKGCLGFDILLDKELK